MIFSCARFVMTVLEGGERKVKFRLSGDAYQLKDIGCSKRILWIRFLGN